MMIPFPEKYHHEPESSRIWSHYDQHPRSHYTGNDPMNYCLAILCATLATSLPSLSGSAAVITTKNIDITVTHSESPCSCGAGGSPNICPSNATPTAGSTINVTLACGSA